VRSLGPLLGLSLLAGCSCCRDGPPSQHLSFVVDDATARRISVSGERPGGAYYASECDRECNLLAGRVAPGAGDANIPDSGSAPPPELSWTSCAFTPSGTSWLLECTFSAPPCPE
jgi:hypothetical protein